MVTSIFVIMYSPKGNLEEIGGTRVYLYMGSVYAKSHWSTDLSVVKKYYKLLLSSVKL